MDKAKHKPKSPLRHFLDEYILFRRDFYFAIEREPEDMIDALIRLWRRDDKYYGIDVQKLEDEPVWQLRVWDKSISAAANAKLYQDKNLTIIEGTVHLEDSVSSMVIGGLILILLLFVLSAFTIQRELFSGGFISSSLLLLAPFFLLGFIMRYFVIKDHKRLVAFMERFMTKEENRLDSEWEKEYKKEKRRSMEND